MDMSYVGVAGSFVIVVIGGGIIKLFIDRAFKSIDENIRDLLAKVKETDIDRNKLWEFANKLNADIIRLQVSSSDTSKVSDLKAEFLEKFQTASSAESDFDMLLASINSLASKFEKLEEKILPVLIKNRDVNEK